MQQSNNSSLEEIKVNNDNHLRQGIEPFPIINEEVSECFSSNASLLNICQINDLNKHVPKQIKLEIV